MIYFIFTIIFMIFCNFLHLSLFERWKCDCNFACPSPLNEEKSYIKFPNSSKCGCCDWYSKLAEESEECIVKSLHNMPSIICGNGLRCHEDKHICVPIKSPCIKERLNGIWTKLSKPKPECDVLGRYEPVQCKNGTICYCVDENGQRIFGESVYEEKDAMNCACSISYASFSKFFGDDINFRRKFELCSSNGNYALQNQHKSDSKCWQEYDHKKLIYDSLTKSYDYVLGYNLPSCDLDGSYKPVQCDDNKCYCVTKDGFKYSEKFSVIKTDDNMKKMNCGCIRDQELIKSSKIKTNTSYIFLSYNCNNYGNYNETQCIHDICFKVDSNGFTINNLDQKSFPMHKSKLNQNKML